MNDTKQKCNCSCDCTVELKLVFPCSGVSDVGYLADRAGRRLNAEKTGTMYCLAGIGGNVEGIVANTRAATRILAIDGCSEDCAKKTLERGGFSAFHHCRVTDYGFEKGKASINNESIEQIASACRELLEK